MSVLAHKWVASGALNGQKAFARARVCVVLHGIMGQGRNWMQAAKALVDAVPTYKVLLVDHRGHGANGATIPGPHDVDACARDVAATVAAATGAGAATPSDASALNEGGGAPLVIGHSFGGKVALAYAAGEPEPPTKTWLLDSNPRRGAAGGGTAAVLDALAAASASGYATKRDAVAALVGRGLDAPTAQWLAMTTETRGGEVFFAYDVDCVRDLYDAYLATDLGDAARELAADGRFGLVAAGRGGMGLEGSDLVTHALPDAGHNVHVDDLPGLLDILVAQNKTDWAYSSMLSSSSKDGRAPGSCASILAESASSRVASARSKAREMTRGNSQSRDATS